MSVAFTKESDSYGAADLPDRPISPHPNLVTPEGLAALEAALAEARAAVAAALASDEARASNVALARAERDLRYFAARRASAEVVEPHPGAETVSFGSRVTIDREDGRRQTFHIVGEDEADPAKGKLSYVSPMARALMGRRVGDTATVAGGEVEIVAIAWN